MPAPIAYRPELTCAVQVKDRKASTKWYTDCLGFSLLYDVPEIGWCEMKSPVEGVAVGFSEVQNPAPSKGVVLTWAVADIDAARQHLESRKVRFDGPTQTIPGLVKLATFYDPDGHPHMLSQNLQGQG